MSPDKQNGNTDHRDCFNRHKAYTEAELQEKQVELLREILVKPYMLKIACEGEPAKMSRNHFGEYIKVSDIQDKIDKLEGK